MTRLKCWRGNREICLPGGGGESQVWCVRASPHLMPTESGPIHRRMHEVINHSIITALTFTFARCALGYHAACRGGTLPEETPEQPPSSRARTGQPSASDPAVGRARGVQACRSSGSAGRAFLTTSHHKFAGVGIL